MPQHHCQLYCDVWMASGGLGVVRLISETEAVQPVSEVCLPIIIVL